MADHYELVFRVHALERMFERGFTTDHVHHVIEHGETIREYPDDTPYPSQLILGWVVSRPVHVVAATNHRDKQTIIVTVYEPDPEIWESDFRRKKP